jgi:hypothetical protein
MASSGVNMHGIQNVIHRLNRIYLIGRTGLGTLPICAHNVRFVLFLQTDFGYQIASYENAVELD